MSRSCIEDRISVRIQEARGPLAELVLQVGGLPVAVATRDRVWVALVPACAAAAALIPSCAAATVLAAELVELLSPLLQPGAAASGADPFAEAAAALALALPLGCPADSFPPRLRAALRADFALAATPPGTTADTTTRRPVWKPQLYRGRPRLELHLREELYAALYDRASAPDVARLVGHVIVRAELEGVPQVNMPLSYQPTQMATPCAFAFDTAAALPARAVTRDSQTSLIFVPPLGEWPMCSYITSPLDSRDFPVRAFYQMKEIQQTEIKVLVQLKLNQHLVNNFEYFDVSLPFAHRSQMITSSMDATPTTGSVTIEKEKRRMLWRIGRDASS